MNGYERINAAIQGLKPDKIPVMLHNFMVAAKEYGITMQQFRDNPKLASEAFIKSVETYKVDGVLVDMDTVTLAGACGVKIDFPITEPARSGKGMIDSYSEINKLQKVNIANYRYVNNWLETVRLVKEHFGNEIYVRGNCDQAPFSLAALLRGLDNWMTDFCMTEEYKIRELLELCTTITLQFIRLMKETGCDMVSNGDSTSGSDLVPVEIHENFAKPYTTRIVEQTHKLELPYLLHICGNTESILEPMIDTGADALELDYKTDAAVANRTMRDKTTFFGNIDPSGILAIGTPGQVRKKTEELLIIFQNNNRFVLNSGCAIPSITPRENIKAMIETARSF